MKYGSENIKFAKCDVANHHQLKGMWINFLDSFFCTFSAIFQLLSNILKKFYKVIWQMISQKSLELLFLQNV